MSSVFEKLILLIILLNSVILAIYNYKDEDDPVNQYCNTIGNISTIVFAVEALLKILARGLILHPRAYLRDGWCVLDFIVVLSG